MQRDDGTEVDRFRNRLMIPICRDTGSVIAFGGRALEKDQQPKYLNSPETPIYSKSRTLYGLSLTKAAIRQGGFAVIVEGLFRFRAGLSGGGQPVVATCGTALTPRRPSCCGASRRKRPRYDPDAAGQGAAERSLRAAGGRRLRRQRRLLPAGDDPDTFVQKHGRDAYVAQLQQSQPYLEFLLGPRGRRPRPERDEARREFLTKCLPSRRGFPTRHARDQFADRLAHKARVTEEVVRRGNSEGGRGATTELPSSGLPAVCGQVT